MGKKAGSWLCYFAPRSLLPSKVASSVSLCRCFLSCFPSVQLRDLGGRCAQGPGPGLGLEPQARPKSQASSSDRGRGCRGELMGVEGWAAGKSSEMCLPQALTSCVLSGRPWNLPHPIHHPGIFSMAPSWGWVGEGLGAQG